MDGTEDGLEGCTVPGIPGAARYLGVVGVSFGGERKRQLTTPFAYTYAPAPTRPAY